jgi:hypothetical protein
MADKFQREIVLDDKILLKQVQKKGELVEKGRAVARAMEDLATQHQKLLKEHNELMVETNNVKLDIIRRTQKLSHGLLGEFELPVTTELRNGKVVFIVTDGLEEFKESFKGFDKWKQAIPRKQKEPEPTH